MYTDKCALDNLDSARGFSRSRSFSVTPCSYPPTPSKRPAALPHDYSATLHNSSAGLSSVGLFDYPQGTGAIGSRRNSFQRCNSVEHELSPLIVPSPNLGGPYRLSAHEEIPEPILNCMYALTQKVDQLLASVATLTERIINTEKAPDFTPLGPLLDQLELRQDRRQAPHIKFWTRQSWDQHLNAVQTDSKGGERAGRNESVKWGFIESPDGQLVLADRKAQISSYAKGYYLWMHDILRSTGRRVPEKWESEASLYWKRHFEYNIENQFSELRYCDDHWKSVYVAIQTYPVFMAEQRKKAAASYDDIEVIDAPTANGQTATPLVAVSPSVKSLGKRRATALGPTEVRRTTEAKRPRKMPPKENLFATCFDDTPSLPSTSPGFISSGGSQSTTAPQNTIPRPSTDATGSSNASELNGPRPSLGDMSTEVRARAISKEPISGVNSTTPMSHMTSVPSQVVSAPTTASEQAPAHVDIPPTPAPNDTGSTTMTSGDTGDSSPRVRTSTVPNEMRMDGPLQDVVRADGPNETNTATAGTQRGVTVVATVNTPQRVTGNKRKFKPGTHNTRRGFCARDWANENPDGTAEEFKVFFDALCDAECKRYDALAASAKFTKKGAATGTSRPQRGTAKPGSGMDPGA